MRLFSDRSSTSPKRRRRLGSAIAEFAIVCPILVVVLLGMIELCRGTMVKVMLSDAARKGCRTGIQRDKGNADILADCNNIMLDNKFDSTKFGPSGNLGSITIVVKDPNG